MTERTMELGHVIAEAEFEVQRAGEEPFSIVFRLGAPVPDPGAPDRSWMCPHQIVGIGDEKVRAIFGVDSLQALILAVHNVPTELGSLARSNGVSITRFGEEFWSLLSPCSSILELMEHVKKM